MSATASSVISTQDDLNRHPLGDRIEVLAAVLDPARLPTPPAVALQVVQAASRPDCKPAEIAAILGRDPALCAKLLKAVNSCIYGLSRPVASIARAIVVLGLSTVRSLALGLSIPAMRPGSGSDAALRAQWLAAVGGAIFARELAVLTRRPDPEDDLVAGLLRDLGAVLLQQTYPAAWAEMLGRPGDRRFAEPCEVEEEVFGISHADVTAEMLRGWNLPEEITEPIRYHHQPERLKGRPPLADRAQLLYFADLLTNLDTVVRHPEVLAYVLAVANDRMGLPRPELVAFLQRVVPKVVEFGRLLDQDIGQCPDFAAVLMAGSTELVNLTVETSRTRLTGSVPMAATVRQAAPTPNETGPIATPPPGPAATLAVAGPASLPEFCPAFAEEFPAGGCRLGPYELRELLGRGAMGIVFKAYEPSLDRFVAVKMLAPTLAASRTARQRFAREARVAAAIQHENVVTVYAVREAAGTAYLAMEYVKGWSLEEYLAKSGPPPVPVIARVARQVAAGLGAAHARLITHRDIKPANILIAGGPRGPGDSGRADGSLTAKISDFGLARAAHDAALSVEGALVGTPHFMSPEQVRGQPADARSDLFSLGGLFYVLCTGHLPFPGREVTAVLWAVCENEPVPPRELRPDLPGWLDELVLRLLRKNPAVRCQSADEVESILAARAGR